MNAHNLPENSPAAAGRSVLGYLLALALCLLAPAAGLRAESGDGGRFFLRGIASGDISETDNGSPLLTENDGRLAGAGTLYLWQAVELSPRFHVFAMEEFEGESGEEGVESELELIVVRYSRRSDNPFSVEAGQITTPIGSFPKRRLPDTNPLVGSPGAYQTEYPLGISVSGGLSRMDYVLSVSTLPVQAGVGTPEPDHAYRPAVGVGLTPLTGLRFGGYFTEGPYLSNEVDPLMPAGSNWRDFNQSVVGLEAQLAKGYLVLFTEFAKSTYEVPAVGTNYHGTAWYLESRYTLGPRLFAAGRIERNQYPYIVGYSGYYWHVESQTVSGLELGMGFRLNPRTLMKGSVRLDDWRNPRGYTASARDGYAVSLQLSHRFDVLDWFRKEL